MDICGKWCGTRRSAFPTDAIITLTPANFRSQRAIEAPGAKKDGVLRHHQARRDGSAPDGVMYSTLLNEWPDVKRHLTARLARHGR